jgi:hypothetical protein
MSTEINLLDEFTAEKLPQMRRRAILPIWIKIFIWLFMIFGVCCPLAFVAALFGYQFSAALYGLSASDANSALGIFIAALFLFKGVVAAMLWMEADIAVPLAIADAIAGIVICTAVMINWPFAVRESPSIVFRGELIILIPYLVKMINIRSKWAASRPKSAIIAS